MKDLTGKELAEAPTTVQFLYVMAMMKQPVGNSMLEKAIKDYPEYFPNEVERRRKYALIPHSVHDAYMQKYFEMHQEVYKDLSRHDGMLSLIQDSEKYAEWNRTLETCRKKEVPLEKAIHKKHYEPYGIKPHDE